MTGRCWRYRSAWLAALQIVCAGCWKSEPPFVPLHGRVLLDGAPLTSGSVTLYRTTGPAPPIPPVSAIKTDGAYEVRTGKRMGATPGDYVVVVYSETKDARAAYTSQPGAPALAIPVEYAQRSATPLRVEVRTDRPEVDLELFRDAKKRRP